MSSALDAQTDLEIEGNIKVRNVELLHLMQGSTLDSVLVKLPNNTIGLISGADLLSSVDGYVNQSTINTRMDSLIAILTTRIDSTNTALANTQSALTNAENNISSLQNDLIEATDSIMVIQTKLDSVMATLPKNDLVPGSRGRDGSSTLFHEFTDATTGQRMEIYIHDFESAGSWNAMMTSAPTGYRLPTYEEALLIWVNFQSINDGRGVVMGSDVPIVVIWTNEELSATEARCLDFPTGTSTGAPKTIPLYAVFVKPEPEAP